MSEVEEFWILRDAIGHTQDFLTWEPTRHTISDFVHVVDKRKLVESENVTRLRDADLLELRKTIGNLRDKVSELQKDLAMVRASQERQRQLNDAQSVKLQSAREVIKQAEEAIRYARMGYVSIYVTNEAPHLKMNMDNLNVLAKHHDKKLKDLIDAHFKSEES